MGHGVSDHWSNVKNLTSLMWIGKEVVSLAVSTGSANVASEYQ